jgi:hypothetical protein
MRIRRHKANPLLRRLAIYSGDGPTEFEAYYWRRGILFREGFQLFQIPVSPRLSGVANVLRKFRHDFPPSFLVSVRLVRFEFRLDQLRVSIG